MQFALDVMALVEELPRTTVVSAVGGQLVRCGTSVGANYRAACRARSGADMLSTLGIVEEEANECVYWFEVIVIGKLLQAERVEPLAREANEIVSMVVASIRTLRDHR